MKRKGNQRNQPKRRGKAIVITVLAILAVLVILLRMVTFVAPHARHY
jgi:hypothetical protein